MKTDNLVALQKFWNTQDLFGSATLNTNTLPIPGIKVGIPGFRALQIYTKMVIGSANGATAGSCDLEANLCSPSGEALTTAPIKILTAIDRFTASASGRKGLIMLGERTVESVLDASAGTIGTKMEMFRSPIWLIQFQVVQNAALVSGPPTGVAFTVEMSARS